MNELKPIDRELLESVKRERTPAPADRERVLASLLATVVPDPSSVSHVQQTVKPSPQPWAGAAKAGLGASAGVGKWIALAALGAAGVGLWVARPSVPPKSSPSVAAPAVTASAPARAVATAAPPPGLAMPLPTSASAAAPSSAPQIVKPGPAAAAPSASSLERELSLLHQAHAAFRAGQPAAALSLLHEHARAFPRSQLSAERSALEVLSLCTLGRQTEAQAVAARLRAAAPGSPAVAGLAGSCAGK